MAGRRRGLPGPERCEPGPTGAFVCVDVQRRRRRWSCGVSLPWAASLFSIITAPRRACAIRVPLRPAASEGEGTGPVEVLPTTLVDWTRLYRDCVLRRTEEYHLSDLDQLVDLERKLFPPGGPRFACGTRSADRETARHLRPHPPLP